MIDRKSISRTEIFEKMAELLDELDKDRDSNGEYQISIVAANTSHRSGIVSLQRGWNSEKECREAINSVFSLGNMLDIW